MRAPGGVILASPVRQSPLVLREFLHSLESFQRVWLFDDNDSVTSRNLLAGFCTGERRVLSTPLPPQLSVPYVRLVTSHYWTPDTYSRVATIKDYLIGEFLRTDAEWLFLVDSDILIPPGLVDHLVSLDLPAVSEVFWTRWAEDTPRLPQVWQVHPGGFGRPEEIISLRTPGVYEVNGLGACTLIHRDVLNEGVDFSPVPGLAYQGEDRFFCLRANVLGIPLYADTQMPAFHVYREDDLETGRAWLDAGCSPETIRSWLDEEWEASVRRWHGASWLSPKCLESYADGTEPWVIDILTSICRAIGAERVLEIGVYKGKTTTALASSAKEVLGIDREIRVDAVNAVAMFPNVRLIEGDAATVIRNLSEQFDFVYVDAGHTYHEVADQVAAVLPHVRGGGVLAFHDALSPEDDYGVKRYVSSRFPRAVFLDTKPFPWTFPTGVAIVTKG